MKCENCPFTRCEGYEERYYTCWIFGEEAPEEYATELGCLLKYTEAKKLYKINRLIDSMTLTKEQWDEQLSIFNNYLPVLRERCSKRKHD